MATSIFLPNGKRENLPGAYSSIVSGIKNPALALAYGNTLVIDTGSGKFFGGGPAINGTLKSGKDALITFDNVRDFRTFVGGGLWWSLSGPLFFPGGGATAGISSLTYIKAGTSVPAEIFVPFGAQDASDTDGNSANNGDVIVQVRAEGYAGNAVLGDETRATATVTVTNAGTVGNSITLKIGNETIATYTVQAGDIISNVIAGLVASISSIRLCDVVSSTTNQVTFYAPRGYADILNGLPATVVVAGTVAGTSSNFTGGVEGTILTRGFAAKVIKGVVDTTKYIVQFYRGTFKGNDTLITNTTPAPFDGVSEVSTKPLLIAQSPEISSVSQLVTWMQDDTGTGYQFNQYFKLKNYVIGAPDVILPQDLTVGYLKAYNGTVSFADTDLAKVLDSISDLTFDFILADTWGTSARSTSNLTIQDWITNTAKIKPDLYVAGGKTEGQFSGTSTSSVNLAQAFNSMYVTLVHGGVKITSTQKGFKEYDSIYKAAAALGREAGLPPQVPMTFKGLGIQGELHSLTDPQARQGLDAGVLMSRLDNGSFDVIKGVNTLQNNQFLVNPDGTTASKQLARIIRQLNKEIVVNAKQQLLKKPNGANRNTVSPEDVKTWLEGYLHSKVANTQDDNLILSFQAVTVTVQGDAYYITYAFTPNFEVSFLVFTGTIIDPNS